MQKKLRYDSSYVIYVIYSIIVANFVYAQCFDSGLFLCYTYCACIETVGYWYLCLCNKRSVIDCKNETWVFYFVLFSVAYISAPNCHCLVLDLLELSLFAFSSLESSYYR